MLPLASIIVKNTHYNILNSGYKENMKNIDFHMAIISMLVFKVIFAYNSILIVLSWKMFA